MKAILSAMPALLRLSLAEMFQYRGEIVLWAVWGVVYPAVGIAMWSAAVAGKADGTQIHGYGAPDFAAYFLLTMIVGHLCTSWDVYEMGHLVRKGMLSPLLLRPILPVWASLADNVAYKVLTLALLIPIWIGVAIVTQPAFNTTVTHVLLGLLAVIMAALLNFLWGYTLATAAFWITRMEGVGETWFGLSLFFGGRLGPLAVLPLPLQWVAAAMPFKWIIWFPSAALMGRLSTREIVWGLLWQACWLVGGLIAFRLAWRVGIKRYTAVGA